MSNFNKKINFFKKIAREYRKCRFKKNCIDKDGIEINHKVFVLGWRQVWVSDLEKLKTETDVKIFLNNLFIHDSRIKIEVENNVIKQLQNENKILKDVLK